MLFERLKGDVFNFRMQAIGKPTNQIVGKNRFALMSYRNMMKRVAASAILKQKKVLRFKGEVVVIVVRESNRLVDQDGLPISAKYFIDAMVQHKVIEEDDPDVCTIICMQRKVSKKEKGTEVLVLKKKELPEYQEVLKNIIQKNNIIHNNILTL